jgi:hypothetical protein
MRGFFADPNLQRWRERVNRNQKGEDFTGRETIRDLGLDLEMFPLEETTDRTKVKGIDNRMGEE